MKRVETFSLTRFCLRSFIQTESGAVQTSSGLVFKETMAGEGPSPAASDTVEVHYEGRSRNHADTHART